MRRTRAVLAAALALTLAAAARAHDGPPYAIAVDRIAGPFQLSVWGDPDVGTGTFWIYLESANRAALPHASGVRVFVRRTDASSPESGYDASPERAPAGTQRFLARVPFDRVGPWTLRVRVASPAGGGETSMDVDVTPPGQGPILDFVLYLFPFVAVAFLFVMAAIRRSSPARTARSR